MSNNPSCFYVCGKYTALDGSVVRSNIIAAMEAGIMVSKATGWLPIVPHSMGSHRVTWEEAMTVCRQTIRSMDPKTDRLVMLPDWETSKGAREEKELAHHLGIPVLMLHEALAVGA